jgi:hypothetical protein
MKQTILGILLKLEADARRRGFLRAADCYRISIIRICSERIDDNFYSLLGQLRGKLEDSSK